LGTRSARRTLEGSSQEWRTPSAFQKYHYPRTIKKERQRKKKREIIRRSLIRKHNWKAAEKEEEGGERMGGEARADKVTINDIIVVQFQGIVPLIDVFLKLL